jgi:hypothetical protein
MFREMYPDGTFLALIRNGLAICEGYVRRGGSAEGFGHLYNRVAARMLHLREVIPGYEIFRYEDMTDDPLGFFHKVYLSAGLDAAKVPKIRQLARPVTDKDGTRVISKGRYRELVWYEPEEFRRTVRSDVNDNQIRQLDRSSRNEFLHVAGQTMERLGYRVS